MDVVKSSLLLLSLALVGCGPAPDMPVYTTATVELLDSKDQKSFYLLPLKAEVKNGDKFWSGDFWALNKGNINFRWNSPLQEGWDYFSPTRDELIFMTPEQIATLSPSEKFDIYLGRYDYPLKEQVYNIANRRALDWEGVGNGWALATIHHNEPTPKVVTNPDGIIIPFGSSDIKALMSYYYAFHFQIENSKQMGRVCPRGNWSDWNESCKSDLNAGSFHVFMANSIGLENQSFMADIDTVVDIYVSDDSEFATSLRFIFTLVFFGECHPRHQ